MNGYYGPQQNVQGLVCYVSSLLQIWPSVATAIITLILKLVLNVDIVKSNGATSRRLLC